MTQYVTGPVNPKYPMELDDGRRVTLSHIERTTLHPELIGVVVTGSPTRGIEEHEYRFGATTWFYRPDTGVFDGSDEVSHFVLRNCKLGFAASVTACRKRKLVL